MSKIGEVTATDKDIPSTGISYSILSGGATLDYSEMFWIDPEKGTIHIVAPLDYEICKSYHLIIQASDNDGETENVSVSKSQSLCKYAMMPPVYSHRVPLLQEDLL